MTKRLILIDGNAILHRAYHALPAMNNAAGQPTNATYGFISILLSVVKELQATHLVVAFDRPKPTFRNHLYKEYQIQRPPMEANLVSQIDVVHEVLRAMKVVIFENDGYEADDVLATIASQAKKHVDEIVVVTGDRDLLQLVDAKTKLYMPIKGLSEAKLFGEQETLQRMGVPPNQIADLKGLMGDASDNYPGVAGIGPKTAIALLQQFGSVENIYQHIDQITNKSVAQKLINDKENALLSYKLATVVRDAPLTFEPTHTQLHDLATREAIELFGTLGFKTLLKRLLNLKNSQDEVQKSVHAPVKETTKNQMGLFE